MDGTGKTIAALTIIRYPRRYIFFAFVAMAVHRLPLFFNKQVLFWKLLGCGKGGGFSKTPDWRQWGIFTVTEKAHFPIDATTDGMLKNLYGGFIAAWLKRMKCETWTVLLEPLEGHGLWDGVQPMGHLPRKNDVPGTIAVLTRATIRPGRLKNFWAHVKGMNEQMEHAEGLIRSVSIGEIPFVKQATFSIWQSTEMMQQFAYGLKQHTDVIQKTRKENWYSEELFVRFRIVKEFNAG